ncbi:MAG: hypothetical protein EAZ57_01330 [Cytophagales bacterium]|nr:MAG: hypothetical protein EAZ67_01945 [Cytophagales bacterium]TAF62092.1 MAG: hypothetical protein EAZ57_01330 [Cytophagales bacterium]
MADYSSLYHYYLAMSTTQNVLLSYKGPVTPPLMAEISRDIAQKISDHPKTGKRVFAIFIELAQNILYYSAEKTFVVSRQESIGCFMITRQEDGILCEFGNLVENEYLDDLVESCNTINSLDKDGLREYKRQQRNSDMPSDRSKGAGIGLIQVAITAETPLIIRYESVSENLSFFSLSVTVKF